LTAVDPHLFLVSIACMWHAHCLPLTHDSALSNLPAKGPQRASPLQSAKPLRELGGVKLIMTMSCRIDRVVSADALVVLFVSGCLTGEHADTLRGVLEQESGGFAIDLENVLLVDREAVKLLAFSEAKGTELRNCPPYIREWVTRERVEMHERPPEKRIEVGEDIEDV
jgi:hypothetical protein